MNDTAQGRLNTIVEEAKLLNPYKQCWDDHHWCLGYNEKRTHATRRIILSFGCVRKSITKTYIPFESEFADFAKSIITLRFVLRNVSLSYQRHMAFALSHLYETMLQSGIVDPTEISRHHFHTTIIRLSHKLKQETVYGYGRLLQEISNFLDENQLTDSPINFQNPVVSAPRADGLDEESQAKGLEKMPSPEALQALGQASSSPIDDDERIMLRIIDLFIVGGFRVGEGLTIPLDCWVEEEGYDSKENGNSTSITKRKTKRYGLRYYPEKCGEPIVKWLPDCAVELAKRAVDDLTVLCAEARNMAALLEKNPIRTPIFKNFSPDELVSAVEIAELLKYKINNIRWFLASSLKIKPINSTPLKWNYYRVGDVEAKLLENKCPAAVLILSNGKIQKLSESLCVMFYKQFDPRRQKQIFQPRLIGYSQVTDALGGGTASRSIFSRRGVTMPDGSPMKIRTHDFRHWLNTLAERGGLSDMELALWMGRRSVAHNAAYKHGTVAERAKWAEKALDEGMLSGDLIELYNTINDPVEKKIFVETFLGIIHFTPFGACSHNFALDPCPKHLKCLSGCGDYMRTKGDQEERRNIQELRDFTSQDLEKAKLALSEGEYGSNNWVTHNEKIVAGCDAALAVDNPIANDVTDLGKAIRVFSDNIVDKKPLQ